MGNRILLITTALCKSGAETQLVKLAFFFKSRNYEVQIISLKPINEFDIDFEEEGVPVIYLKSWLSSPISNGKFLLRKLKAFKPDVVIAFMFISIIFARILKKYVSFKLISSIRTAVIPFKWYIPFKLTSGLDDIVVYNAKASKESFESKGIIKQNGVVIHNSIHIPDIEKLDDKPIPNDKFKWICIAHFKWNKDYKTLFKAIQILKGRNFSVDIIGGYTSANNPFPIIKELGIEEHVNILGFKQNTSDYLKNADAFVLSSLFEGMPNALLEAMAYAKPVLVTDIACNKEVVQFAACGYLSNKKDEEDLAVKMLRMMIAPPNIRQKLGENGRSYIKENFSQNDVMNNWLQTVNYTVA
ncbi:MAG TPA: glycosyltransferase [Pelobium sp.]|nr:glycosyltransferase [Pelobium sp.]